MREFCSPDYSSAQSLESQGLRTDNCGEHRPPPGQAGTRDSPELGKKVHLQPDYRPSPAPRSRRLTTIVGALTKA
jgi:hypothetical protein